MNYKKVKTFLLLVVITAISGVLCVSRVRAVDSLDNPRDIISNDNPSGFSQHSIRFGIPVTSPPVRTTDYIFVDLPYFSMVSEPTYISGNYDGTPSYQVLSTRIRVTGISIAPGNYISINGVTSYNPSLPENFDVGLRIATDPDGLVVRNAATVLATGTDGSIVVTALLDARVGTLRIQGYSAPGMFITFTEGGAVIGTAQASLSGSFSHIFPGITPTQHNIEVFGVDSQNRITPPTPIQVYTQEYQMVTVTGIVLAPTLSVNKSEITKGEGLAISGSGVPDYKAIVFTEPPLSSQEIIVGADGSYSYNMADTSNLELGEHRVYSLLQDGRGSQSMVSFNQIFKVIDGSTPPERPPGACDFSQGDLNCDSKVNLTDFSILLYYWGLNSGEADVNQDGNVNLVDFSIMMFYWQG